MAHQSILEWALAMSALRLPPYVLEHIFNYLNHVVIADIGEPPSPVEDSFVHSIVQDRTHQENIALFIAVARAHQRLVDNRKANE